MIAVRALAGQALLGFALGVWGGVAWGQDEAPTRFARGVLWKLERPGVAPNWAFGTLHLDDERITGLQPAVQRALRQSRRLALELLVTDEEAERFDRARYLSGVSGQEQMLGSATAARLRHALAQRGVPQRLAARLKPWAAMLVLVAPPPPYGEILDQVIEREARSAGLAVHPLETLDEQLAAFEALPAGVQRELVENLLENLPHLRELRDDLVRAWRDQDLALMWRIDTGFLRRDRAFTEANRVFVEHVVRRRNRSMAGRLLPLLEEGGVFVAVGALHLAGDDGLLALAEAQGWRVSRVALER